MTTATKTGAARRARRRHGLGVSGVEALLAKQEGRCAICGVTFEDVPGRRGAIDHDHRHCPGKIGCPTCIRGVLCNGCNNILRLAKDDPTVLLSAVSYLAVTTHGR